MQQLLVALVVGAVVGTASGAFGKGGSALATPLLAAAGIPPLVAIATPLPATIPSTAVAGRAYARAGLVDGHLVRMGIVVGLPLTAAGALLTRWVPGPPLVLASELLVLGLAFRMLLQRSPASVPDGGDEGEHGAPSQAKFIVTVAIVAFVSGLLGNSGGVLLAPLFATVLGLPVKRALGTSLAIALALAIPGTVVHALLGHIEWPVTIAFALASVPFARLGASLSLRAQSRTLARTYPIALVLMAGTAMLVTH